MRAGRGEAGRKISKLAYLGAALAGAGAIGGCEGPGGEVEQAQAAIVTTCTWAQQTPQLSPPARNHHMMGYDSFNHVTVMFGGFYGTTPSTAPGTFFTDVWHWTGSAWIRKADFSRTIARSAFAYDSDRHVFVSNGGNKDPIEGDYNPPFGETWEYNAATDTWTQKAIGSGPPQRQLHAMSYDSVRRVMVLVAENDVKGAPPVVWEYDGVTSTWTQRPVAPFAGRNRHAMIFDGTRTLLYGGKPEHSTTGPDFADTWSYNGSTWTEITSAGGIARSRHCMVWDSGANAPIVAYGTSSTVMADDVSMFDGALWQPTASDAPNRNYFGMSYQSHLGKSVVFGGLGGGSLGDTWSLTCSSSGGGAVCGNGVVEAGEACDDGNTDPCVGSCNASCTAVSTLVNYYVDTDVDGYGAGAATPSYCPISGRVTTNADCDNSNAGVHPGAAEICGNGVDEDCSGADLPCGNILANPGFEATGGWSGDTSFTDVTTPVHTGAKAKMGPLSTKIKSISQTMAATAGRSYSFSGWINTASVTGGAQFELVWLNSSGGVLRTDVVGLTTGTVPWTQRAATLTSPTGTVNVKVALKLLAGTGTAYFDDLSLQ